jgi:carboxymethylenebutenolidase
MPITIENVQITSTHPAMTAYLALPEGEGRGPAVVVIHEAFGLNDHIKDVTRRFAEQGYVALAVDLFAGRNQVLCMFRFFGGMFLNSLDHEAIRNLKGSLDWLETQPRVDSNRVGAIGFCLGGGLAIAWACTDPRLRVIAPFYGFNPRPLNVVERACPVVGSYPENDFTKGMGEKLNTALQTYQIAHDIKVYPGARHSFFNDQGPSYDAAAATDAWGRVIQFFESRLA